MEDPATGIILQWVDDATDFRALSSGALKGGDYINKAQEMTTWAYDHGLIKPVTMERINRYNFRHAVGTRLSAARKEKGITQEQLAAMTGIDRGHIARIEGGRMNTTLDTLEKICTALDISLIN